MRKLLLILGLCASPVVADVHYFTSGDFEREWTAEGHTYTAQELEAFVDRFACALCQPAYIACVKELINDGIINDDQATRWQMLLPLQSMTVEDMQFLHYFFLSMKQYRALKNSEYLLVAQLEHAVNPDPYVVALLIKVRQDMQELMEASMIAALGELAVAHAAGVMTPQAVAYSNECAEQFNLRWIPLMLASQELACMDYKQELTQDQQAQMLLVVLMGITVRSVMCRAQTYEQYKERTAIIGNHIEKALTVFEEHKA